MTAKVLPLRRPCFNPVLFSWRDDAVRAADVRAGATGRRQKVSAHGSLWRVEEVDL